MRIVEQKLWLDSKWRKSFLSNDERYFWLYLLTCPSSKCCGIFYIPIDIMVMESKISEDKIKEYINHLTEMGMIVYSFDTEEILIYNLPRYNIIRLGKPMIDCIKSELSNIKNSNLIKCMITFIEKYISTRINDKKINVLTNILDIYKESISITISISNESCHDSCNDSQANEEEWNNLLKQIDEACKK